MPLPDAQAVQAPDARSQPPLADWPDPPEPVASHAPRPSDGAGGLAPEEPGPGSGEPGLTDPGPAATPAFDPSAPAAAFVSLPTLAPPPRAPERLLILDTETTALSPDQGDCIEVGAVLFHLPSRAVLQQISFLLPTQSNPAEAINGIPAAVTRLHQPLEAARSCFLAMAASADAVVAHNAAFDRQWFGLGGLPELGLPWICSMEDIRWPADRLLRPAPSVRDLALAYGVPVWAAHRALTDCHYLVHVFQRCPDLEALLVDAQEPRQLYRAHLPYAERHRAREAGFRWNEPLSGAWSRRLTAAEAAALPFPVEPVDADPVAFLPCSA